MVSSIANTVSLIQNVAGGITGIKSAPATFPNKLDRVELPFVLTIPETGTTNQHTFKQDNRITERNYSVRCYVEALGQNRTSNRIDLAITLLQRFIETFETNRELQSGITITNAIRDSGVITGDEALTSGLIKMNIANQFYSGFYLTLEIMEYYTI